jgi:hypothetical protein
MLIKVGFGCVKDVLSIKWEMVATVVNKMSALKTKSKLQMDIASHVVMVIKSHRTESHVIKFRLFLKQ